MAEKTIVLFRPRYILLVLASIAALLVLFWQPPQVTVERRIIPSSEPLSIGDYTPVSVAVSPSILYLTAHCRQVAMVTTDAQSYSIQNALDGKIDGRPTAHDVFHDLIQNFGIDAKMAKIDAYENSTYYATIYVQQGNKLLGLDARPSDAIAIAVRENATIYMRTELLNAGKVVC